MSGYHRDNKTAAAASPLRLRCWMPGCRSFDVANGRCQKCGSRHVKVVDRDASTRGGPR